MNAHECYQVVAACKEGVDICGHSAGQVINCYKYFKKKNSVLFLLMYVQSALNVGPFEVNKKRCSLLLTVQCPFCDAACSPSHMK